MEIFVFVPKLKYFYILKANSPTLPVVVQLGKNVLMEENLHN